MSLRSRGARRRRAPEIGGEPPPNPPRGANSGHSWDGRARGARGRFVGRPPADRFWERVEPNGGCLVRTGDLDKDGYARFRALVGGAWVDVPAHVWAWTQEHGPVPDGHSLDHLCHSFDDTCPPGPCPHRACVLHLEPVPLGENQRRARARRPAMPPASNGSSADQALVATLRARCEHHRCDHLCRDGWHGTSLHVPDSYDADDMRRLWAQVSGVSVEAVSEGPVAEGRRYFLVLWTEAQ